MGQAALNICATAIAQVVVWFDQLVNAMGVGGIIFTAFCVCGVISMLFMPFRGSFGIGLGDDYYTSNVIHRPRRQRSNVIYAKGPDIRGSVGPSTSLTVRD